MLSKEGYSSRRIAKILEFHHSTISRELKRCGNEYESIYAQKDKITSIYKNQYSNYEKT